LTGRAFVIVDGVDELGDSSKRSDFIDLVDTFSTAYPLTRIIVTSREVGYDEADLDEEAFPVVVIRPFDEGLVSRYARLWFGLENQPQLVEPFLAESERVSDIRNSPLVLFLLCTLYQASKAFPRIALRYTHAAPTCLSRSGTRRAG
jgi:predicted NACHT family NTPase